MGKSDNFKWYPREPAKMIRGVVGMGAALIGCYNVILDLIYEDEGSCPNDAAFIAGILGESPRQARALISKLLELGKLEQGDDGRLRNKKAEAVIKLRASQSKKAAENGALGGRSRAAKLTRSNKNKDVGQATLKHLEKNREEKNREDLFGQKPSASAPKRRAAIPEDFPSPEAKAAGQAYWRKNGRPDLADQVGEQAQQFRDHHLSHGKTMADWPAAWRTWVRNALTMTRPPRQVGAPSATPVRTPAEEIAIWVGRLEDFHFGFPGDEHLEARPAGYWRPDFGPKPGQDGCRVPAEAEAEFRRRHPVRAVK